MVLITRLSTMSLSTAPASTEGSWFGSPTITTLLPFFRAVNNAVATWAPTIEYSSIIISESSTSGISNDSSIPFATERFK